MHAPLSIRMQPDRIPSCMHASNHDTLFPCDSAHVYVCTYVSTLIHDHCGSICVHGTIAVRGLLEQEEYTHAMCDALHAPFCCKDSKRPGQKHTHNIQHVCFYQIFHIAVRIYIYIYIYISYIRVCMYMYVRTCVCMYVCMYVYTYVCMYLCMHIHTHIYLYMYTHTHTHTHTNEIEYVWLDEGFRAALWCKGLQMLTSSCAKRPETLQTGLCMHFNTLYSNVSYVWTCMPMSSCTMQRETFQTGLSMRVSCLYAKV
jgi:hypothetical protein